MIHKTARTLGMSVLAGSMVLGMSACTNVEKKSDDAASKATSAATSMTDSAAASNSASQPSSDTQTSAPSSDTSSDTATDGGDSSGGGLVTGKVGQDVKTNKYTVKVNKVTENPKSKYDFEKPDAGKHWVDVNVTVTNTGSDKKMLVSDMDFKAKLTDNTSPDASIASGVGTQLTSDGLFKGDTVTGDVVYQVPEGQKIKQIDVDLDSFSLDGGQTARIDLG